MLCFCQKSNALPGVSIRCRNRGVEHSDSCSQPWLPFKDNFPRAWGLCGPYLHPPLVTTLHTSGKAAGKGRKVQSYFILKGWAGESSGSLQKSSALIWTQTTCTLLRYSIAVPVQVLQRGVGKDCAARFGFAWNWV